MDNNESHQAASRAESVAGLLRFMGWLTFGLSAVAVVLAAIDGRADTVLTYFGAGLLATLLLFGFSAHLGTQAAILRELMKR